MGVRQAYLRGYTLTDEQLPLFLDADSADTYVQGPVKLREGWHIREWEAVIIDGGDCVLSVRTCTYAAWAGGDGLTEAFSVEISGGQGRAMVNVDLPAGSWLAIFCVSVSGVDGLVGLDLGLVAS